MADLFKLPERLVTIVLDEGEYAGVEATVRLPRSVGAYWAIERLAARRGEGETDEEWRARLVELYETAARDVLVSWNVVDHAGPIPITSAGLARADAALLGSILGLWGVATERSPFVKPSPATEPSGRRKSRRAGPR